MFLSSSRRVEVETIHDFYWVMDDQGRMGIKINLKNIAHDSGSIGKINGIILITRINENSENEFFLMINNPSDRDIFYRLCMDLINNSLLVDGQVQLYKSLSNRLRHWQRFLSQSSSKTMTEQLQMGLFTELSFLNEDVLHLMNNEQALLSWIGPDFDKQDFSFEGCLAEIKSFITSKGPFVKISSMHQLFYDLKPLYLIAFGISRVAIGRSIIDLIKEIRKKLNNPLTVETFDIKLAKYGYFEGITEEPFFNYFVDSKRIYSVESGFPRIVSNQISNQILAVQYSIDLSKCSLFETTSLPLHLNNH